MCAFLREIAKGLTQFLKSETSNTVGRFNLAFSLVLLILVVIAFFDSLVENILRTFLNRTSSVLEPYIPLFLFLALIIFVVISLKNIPPNLPRQKTTATKRTPSRS